MEINTNDQAQDAIKAIRQFYKNEFPEKKWVQSLTNYKFEMSDEQRKYQNEQNKLRYLVDQKYRDRKKELARIQSFKDLERYHTDEAYRQKKLQYARNYSLKMKNLPNDEI